MALDAKSSKTKVFDIDENYNFVVDEFSFVIIWWPNSTTEVLTIWNQIYQTSLNAETTNINVVDLDKTSHFVVVNFLSQVI